MGMRPTPPHHPEHDSLFFWACLPNGYHEYRTLVPDPSSLTGHVVEILYEQPACGKAPPRLVGFRHAPDPTPVVYRHVWKAPRPDLPPDGKEPIASGRVVHYWVLPNRACLCPPEMPPRPNRAFVCFYRADLDPARPIVLPPFVDGPPAGALPRPAAKETAVRRPRAPARVGQERPKGQANAAAPLLAPAAPSVPLSLRRQPPETALPLSQAEEDALALARERGLPAVGELACLIHAGLDALVAARQQQRQRAEALDAHANLPDEQGQALPRLFPRDLAPLSQGDLIALAQQEIEQTARLLELPTELARRGCWSEERNAWWQARLTVRWQRLLGLARELNRRLWRKETDRRLSVLLGGLIQAASAA